VQSQFGFFGVDLNRSNDGGWVDGGRFYRARRFREGVLQRLGEGILLPVSAAFFSRFKSSFYHKKIFISHDVQKLSSDFSVGPACDNTKVQYPASIFVLI
jgi:hypothetical protein